LDLVRPIRHLLPHFAANRLGGQSVLAFGLKLWGAVASFGLNWLIARHFGPAGSGQFGIALTTLMITSYCVLAGLDTIVVRSVAGDLAQHKTGEARGVVATVTRTLAFAAPLVAATMFVLREPLATHVLHQPGMATMLGIMIWALVPLTLQRIASAALRASGNIMMSQIIDGPVGTTLAAVGLAIGIATGFAQTMAVPAYLYLAGILVGSVVGWLSFRRSSRAWSAAVPLAVTPLIVAGLPILLSNLSQVFTEWYTTVSLGAHWPVEVVGQYRTAWQFVTLAGLVQLAMEVIIGPRIAAAARIGDTAAIARVARRMVGLVLVLASPLFIVIFLAPGFLLGIFGPRFVGGSLALQILGLGQLVRLAAGPLGVILVMTGNQRWVLLYAGSAVVLCVGFALWLIPLYGAAGAAAATAAAMIGRNLIAVVIVHFVLRINLFRKPTA
jgi:O-antigen/teichoic acid export membrane protein